MLIDGYVNKSCYYNGEDIEMYLNYSKTILNYNINIYDLNLNIVDTIQNINVQENIISNINPWKNGAGYNMTVKYNLKNYISGIYLIDKKISFIVKEKKISDFIVVYPINTIELYNTFGGKNGYYGLEKQKQVLEKRGKTLSFNRPKKIGSEGTTDICKYSYGFFKWLINTKYNFNIISDNEIENIDDNESNIIIIAGHSEYWSKIMRTKIDYLNSIGFNIIYLSGNTMWWNVQINKELNQIICCKDISDEENLIYDKTINTDIVCNNPHPLELLGNWFRYGGIKNSSMYEASNKYTFINKNSIILKDVILENNCLTVPYHECDGCDIIKVNNKYKLINRYNFYKYELIGYDINQKNGNNMSFIILKRYKNYGTIINTGNMNWCAKEFLKNTSQIKITENIIDNLIINNNLFSENGNSINIYEFIMNLFKNHIENKINYKNILVRTGNTKEIYRTKIISDKDNIFKIKLIELSGAPGIMINEINVSPNNNYIIKFFCNPIIQLKVIFSCNVGKYYIINKNNEYYIYFENTNNTLLNCTIGVKYCIKNMVIDFKNLEIYKV